MASIETRALVLPFVGTWHEFTVKDEGEVLEGTLVSEMVNDGTVFRQHFASSDGSFTFVSFGYVDAEADRWFDTYIFNNGRVAKYWWIEEGGQLFCERIDADGIRRRRLRLFDVSFDLYKSAEEYSDDDGITWTRRSLTHTRRVND